MYSQFCAAVEERLLRYVQIDSQSDESSSTIPSTATQYDLLRPLVDELTAIGAQDVTLTDYATVLATIPATLPDPTSVPVIAFLAHVDTAPAFSGTGVVPRVHRNYDGGSITYPDAPGLVLSPDGSPYLAEKLGEDIITASGSTLLGADDKSGVAVIMTMAEALLADPSIPHGTIRIAFTPDEEIGKGVRLLTPDGLGADFAYTLDGGEAGELSFETFSADKAVVTITGVSIHPGTAFGKLVNALTWAAKFVALLPAATRTPETTQDRQGFIHLTGMEGNAAQAKLSFILRDFEREGLASHGALLESLCATVRAAEPRLQVTCAITPQYRNMRYWLENDMRPVELAAQAIRDAGLQPVYRTVRGGTDGSQMTEKGVPTPNLFTGQQDLHGPLEWISVQDMARAVEVCLGIVRLTTTG
ncbi:MAG: peptidase T [Chloroflexi bacterium]|nr:MAG: peptidase T [Chloroflexota bacterium]